uniref:NADH-ubiquinone oxidoreductase chain 4L n=1 Tax=Bambusiphaga taibaishana TaxID=2008833 RepID=A0A7S4YZC6_9HEMI|nr:NADH dehydrogenase subunit 4L [Bambusiphaga taibaishana]QBZ37974.1 NADH dehydrogenase subunit 4L [Bambusiphaga taibaishana]
MYLIFFMFITGLFCCMMVRKHYLLTLISLEMIFLSLFFFFFFFVNNYLFEMYFILIILIFGVCGASMGLSILVYLVRKVGFDYLNNFSLC